MTEHGKRMKTIAANIDRRLREIETSSLHVAADRDRLRAINAELLEALRDVDVQATTSIEGNARKLWAAKEAISAAIAKAEKAQ